MTMWALAHLTACLYFVSLDFVLASTSRTSTSPTASTSPFRTVNYITQSLAQQCLASPRKANVTSAQSESNQFSQSTVNIIGLATIDTNGLSTSISALSTGSASVTTVPCHATSSTLEGVTQPTPKETPPVFSTPIIKVTEEESPLEESNFLSFEDWKRDNLKKAGQSESIGKLAGLEDHEPRQRPVALRDSLDALGDDAEIDLDFSGFASDGLEPPTSKSVRVTQDAREASAEIEPGRAPKARVRSEDAGTTCKERFNYASFDCAANVLKWNPEAKSPSAVLGENKDSYMLNECSAKNKFLILELCNDISIDTIVLANFEFFSSTFQTFRVSVSDKYPVKTDKWKTLATFEARNSREVQAFLVENPVIWARYLRIEFLTFYGNEFYCPVSLVRVHGTTMLEDYKRDLEALQLEEEDEADEELTENVAEDGLVPDAVAEQLLTRPDLFSVSVQKDEAETATIRTSDGFEALSSSAIPAHSIKELDFTMPTCPAELALLNSTRYSKSAEADTCEVIKTSASTMGPPLTVSDLPISSSAVSKVTSPVPRSSLQPETSRINITSSFSDATSTEPSEPIVTAKSNLIVEANSSSASFSPTSANSSKTVSSSTQSPLPVPTMQESFFKSVQKRLQMIEANSSLSLQYIEAQSRSLRDAFQKVEQRQLAKTTSFLDYLNTTVLNELREFRQQYDQLWQSTVIELDMQRERYQRDNVAINARLGVLADEVIFQKRISFLQLILIVICLGLVLFSKGNLNSYLELPLVQSVLSRSPGTRFVNVASPDTPVQSSPVSRSNSTGAMRKRSGILKGHRRFPSQDSATENTLSPVDPYEPSTPVSYGDPLSEGEILEDNSILGDPEFDPNMIERPSTSPPVLSVADSPTISDLDDNIGGESIDSIINMTPTRMVDRKGPRLIIEDATPAPKHLKWQLPDG